MANNNQLNIEIKVNRKELADAKADLKSFTNELKMYSKAEVEQIKANAKIKVSEERSALEKIKGINQQATIEKKTQGQKELIDYKETLRQKVQAERDALKQIAQQNKLNSKPTGDVNRPFSPTSLGGLKQQETYYKQFLSTLSAGNPAIETTKTKLRSLGAEIDKFGISAKNSSGAFENFTSGLMAGGAIGAVIAGLTIAISLVKDFINEANKLQAATLGLESVSKFKGINPDVAVESVKNLQLVKDGLLTVGDASLALKNLLASNFTLEQSIELIKRFGDAAAFGRQAGLDFGYAITSATEGIKNGNSILVDNAGVTKNLSVILTEAGFSATDVNKATSDLNIRMALYNGLIKETNAFNGDAVKLTETFAGEQQKLDAQITIVKQNLGIGFQRALIGYIETVNGANTSTEDFGKVLQVVGQLMIQPFWMAFPSMINNIAKSFGDAGIVIETLFGNSLFNAYNRLQDIISLFSDAREAINNNPILAPSDRDVMGGDYTMDWKPTVNTKKAGEGFDLTKDKKGRTPKDNTTRDFLLSLQEEIELRKLLKTLTFDFLKTKENELRSQLAITTADKDRLKILKEINSVIQEQTEFVNKLIEKQKNQRTTGSLFGLDIADIGKSTSIIDAIRDASIEALKDVTKEIVELSTVADNSIKEGDALRTNRGILGNATSSPQEIGNINDKSYRQEQLEKGYDLLVSNSSEILSNTQNIFDILGVGTETFVYKMIGGFQDALSVVNSIVAILNTVNQVKQGFNLLTSLFSFVPGAGVANAVGAVAGGRNIGSLASGGGQSPIVNKIYINSTLDTQKFIGDGVTTFYKNRNLNTVG